MARPSVAAMLPLPMSLYRSLLVLPAMLHSGSSEEELAALTVVELKERLRELGRPVSGKKVDLIARVRGEAAEGGPTARSRSPAAADPPPSSSSPRTSAGGARSIIPMDPTPRRRRGAESARTLLAASWNVAGLRGLLKREEGRATLRHLVASERVDVLLLQVSDMLAYRAC